MKSGNLASESAFDMPISEEIWDRKYRFKEADGTPIDSTVEDTWLRVAEALAVPERAEKRAEVTQQFYEALEDWKFLPAGRIIAGAGTGRAVTLFNCYVMGTIPDSLSGIFENLREAAMTMQQGGGIGYDFSTIRPKGALVKKLGADASGPLSFMDCWDTMCKTIMSAGGRRGAMMATLRCDHPDIVDFVTAKKDPARLRHFNVSVLVTDAFMTAVEDDLMWELIWDGEVVEEISARYLWDLIMKNTYSHAEPGVIFIDRINDTNNLRYIERIAATNPCGEQPLPPYGACLLGSINLARLVREPFTDNAHIDDNELRKLVKTAVRMMDNVIDTSLFPLDAQRDEALRKRRLGLGMTGVADALMMLGIVYGTDQAAEQIEEWASFVEINAYIASVNLAYEKGPFPDFIADGFLSPGTHASKLPEGLQLKIRDAGIRNSHLTSIAPTGTISLYGGNVSSGIEPVFAASYTRNVTQMDGTRVPQTVTDFAVAQWQKTMGYDEGIELPPAYIDAQTLTPEAHVKMQAAAQRWVDSSISKTINVPEDIDFDAFKKVYEDAYAMGCKGCTTYRPNEITGSILSVESKPEEKPESGREFTPEKLKPIINMAARLLSHDKTCAQAKLGFQRFKDHSGKKLSEISTTREYEYATTILFEILQKSGIDGDRYPGFDPEGVLIPFYGEPEEKPELAVPTVDGEPIYEKTTLDTSTEPYPLLAALQKRPDELDGTTYKLKFGDSNHALYVTITDSGGAPYEIFINTKDPSHYQWSMALTRMISAVFRRGGDVAFVPEELKSVFDPTGGAFHEGRYVPSLIAAIGGIIEKHMGKNASVQMAFPDFVDGPIDHYDRDTMTKTSFPVVTTKGKPCPVCSSYSFKHEAGCSSCTDCGWSSCG